MEKQITPDVAPRIHHGLAQFQAFLEQHSFKLGNAERAVCVWQARAPHLANPRYRKDFEKKNRFFVAHRIVARTRTRPRNPREKRPNHLSVRTLRVMGDFSARFEKSPS